jgi:hypothetical protein
VVICLLNGEERTKKIVSDLSNYVNSSSTQPELFAGEVMRDHRTLQQSMFKLFCACIIKWSKCASYDLRNEYTVKLCKEIVEKIGEDKLKYIPYI